MAAESAAAAACASAMQAAPAEGSASPAEAAVAVSVAAPASASVRSAGGAAAAPLPVCEDTSRTSIWRRQERRKTSWWGDRRVRTYLVAFPPSFTSAFRPPCALLPAHLPLPSRPYPLAPSALPSRALLAGRASVSLGACLGFLGPSETKKKVRLPGSK